MNYSYYLAFLPFFFFIAGYYGTDYFLYVPSIETPNVSGKNISHAARILSRYNLNLRIIQEKEDNDLPDGTIIHQSPYPLQKVKADQTIFCTISHQSQAQGAPNLLDLDTTQMYEQLKKERIKTKTYYMPSEYKENICIAQFPSFQEPLHQRSMITYVTAARNQVVIFPSLLNKSIKEVQEFFELHNKKINVFHKSTIGKKHDCQNCYVTSQKPLAGSILDLTTQFEIQVQVQEKNSQ